jgi:hypothetical protein
MRPHLLLVLAACGRVHFVAMPDASGDGSSSDTPDRPNVAFVTSALMGSNLGGLQGADIMCQQAAMGAGLPGTFIALMSTSTTNARDRIAGSRGWVRTDGVALADMPSDMFLGGHLLNPIDHDVAGNQMPRVQLDVWTGTASNGTADTVNTTCGDWTGVAGLTEVGFHDRSAPFDIATSAFDCGQAAHVYCFEVGHDAAVTPSQASGRIAFLSQQTGTVGLSGFDSQCASDATAAGLPGTYLAAVAVNGASAASRLPAGAPWHRVDGTLIAATDAAIFSSNLMSFVNQAADGTYAAGSFTAETWSGATNGVTAGTDAGTCTSWTVTTGSAIGGSPIDTSNSGFWGGTAVTCNITAHVLCLQQ